MGEDEHWKMAVAERLEDIVKLLTAQGNNNQDATTLYDPHAICPACHHDKEEHTSKGCFHYDGSEDRSYCWCNEPFTKSEGLAE